jgi:hypothetical protein
MAAGRSGAEEGHGAVRPGICSAGVTAADMACGVDPGTSVFEGSDVLALKSDGGMTKSLVPEGVL